jgi:hypothetical protein
LTLQLANPPKILSQASLAAASLIRKNTEQEICKMSVSRRKLLQNSVLAAFAFAAGRLHAGTGQKDGSSADSPPDKPAVTLKTLDRAAFAGALGSGFQVSPTTGKSSPAWLRLLAVQDLPALASVNPALMAVPPQQKSAPIQTTGFMLQFLGTLPEPLKQGTYNFDHPQLGKFSLLIVPEGPGQQTYIAVINRL